MYRSVLSAAVLAAFLALPGTVYAQGFYVGPGGVGFDDGRPRRGYDDARPRRGYYEERRGGGRREMCRELRRACMYKEELGEQGGGNCRRYRNACT